MVAPAAETALSLQCLGLEKTFRDFWYRPRARAVRGIDLAVKPGEVFGLLGPNGSGKSTTIKMILGLLHPSAGKIAVLGRPPRDVENKRRIGYLPEESYHYKYLTARETIDFYGKLFGLTPANRRVRTDMLLEMVGLSHVADRQVGEFSKGMQRKVGLAQALVNDPELIILDEPTSGMDPIAIHETKEVIAALKQRGKTILLCSHQLSEVEDVCDRVVIMYGGLIRAEGTVAEVVAGRRNLEAAFMDIVRGARTEGADTSGATEGKGLAGFLSGSPAAAPAAEDRRILAAPPAAPAATPAKAAPPPAAPARPVELSGQAAAPAAPAPKPLDQAALAALVAAPKPAPVAPAAPAVPAVQADMLAELSGQKLAAPAAPPKAEPKKDAKADRSVLDDLVG